VAEAVAALVHSHYSPLVVVAVGLEEVVVVVVVVVHSHSLPWVVVVAILN